VQVARSSANREELARRLLLDTLLPLSMLMLALSALVWAGIRAGLAPLARLRQAVEGRAPNDLRPIQINTAPTELRSLALAINHLLEAVQTGAGPAPLHRDAAHQLRTPLAGLKSQAELALADASPGPQQERLQRVVEAATRSAHLVGQLLSLARAEPEAVGGQRGFEPLDLARLARELTAEWVPRALAAGVDLGMDDASLCNAPVRGQPTLLREALANLLDNALRYAGRGAWSRCGDARRGRPLAAERQRHRPRPRPHLPAGAGALRARHPRGHGLRPGPGHRARDRRAPRRPRAALIRRAPRPAGGAAATHPWCC
jgi:two-component system sensor histidine kinase TctE